MENQGHNISYTVKAAMYLAIYGGDQSNELKGAFSLINQVASGTCLLVGEGNLSFGRSLLNFNKINPKNLIATTFKRPSSLSNYTQENAKHIYDEGGIVIHGVNARTLHIKLENIKFSTIIFQFPHTGRRRSVEGKNPNYILIRDFLNSARQHLTKTGLVCISAVDNPHYRGAFQFEKAAKSTGYHPPKPYLFDPKKFRGYNHTMTHNQGSALDRHQKFKTWVFKPK